MISQRMPGLIFRGSYCEEINLTPGMSIVKNDQSKKHRASRCRILIESAPDVVETRFKFRTCAEHILKML